MVQYSSLFNSSRIPGIGKDKLVKNEAAKHILIMKGGNFYIFDAIDSNGMSHFKMLDASQNIY